jgi:carbamoyltransferase
LYVLGISCFYHDAAACLIRDGEIVAAAEEERFTRKKHDSAFPAQAVSYCLSVAGIGPEEVDHVIFYEKPLLKFERILSSCIDTFPHSRAAFVRAMEIWLSEKLWAKGLIQASMHRRGRITFGEHHVSHAASAFLVSPFEEAAVLSVDGVGEWTTTATGAGHGTEMELIREIRFPHSLGLLYSAFTAYLGFEVNEGEYKVMGMAAYGRPKHVDKVRSLLDLASDGSYQLDLRHFEHHRALRTYSARFEGLFGSARRPDGAVTQRHMDVAASVQQVLEEVLVTVAADLRRVSGLRDICLAGGVALNGLANTRILREAGFERMFVQPAAGDSGGAIGAAAFLYHAVLGRPRVAPMRHAYLGPEYDADTIEAFLDRNQIPAVRLGDDELLDSVSGMIERGAVVGWFQGRMEFGPRALGSRSILADARRAEMKDVLNEKIKHRESFRPFAPAVLVEEGTRWFELPADESPYMLHIVPVRADKRSLIPAVTHEDGTARVQTVDRHTNPRFHALISRFAARTGVPVIINTSFNVKGEPIVRTPAEAYNCFAHTDIDHLVLGPFVVDAAAKRRFMPYPGRERIRETDELPI